MFNIIRNSIIAMVLLISACIPAGSASASLNNPNTDWFMNAKYGYFFHYLAGYNDITAANTADWNASVNSFDVNAFANNVELGGAGYVVLTLGQNSGYYNSPNATYESLAGYSAGARTSTRDLPLELYNALNPKGIKLMLYLPSNAPGDDSFAANNMGLYTKNNDGANWDVNPEFGDKWAQVIQTWSDRYGSKIAGWWFDGYWSMPDSTYAQKYTAAVKHGNPNAIVTFNPGVGTVQKNPNAGDYEDYSAGELNQFGPVPTGRWLNGIQWHVLSFLGSFWSQGNVKYSDGYLIDHIKSVNLNQGVVTMDAKVSKNGSFSTHQLAQMKAIKAGVRDGIPITYKKIKNRTTGMVVDNRGATNNGAEAGQWSNVTSNNLLWQLIDLGNGYSLIRNKANGMLLDGGARTTNGSLVYQWSAEESTNLEWQIIALGNGYYKIKNRTTGMVLDGGARTTNGSLLYQWSDVTSTNLEWSF